MIYLFNYKTLIDIIKIICDKCNFLNIRIFFNRPIFVWQNICSTIRHRCQFLLIHTQMSV